MAGAVIDVQPGPVVPGAFPGLYTASLPRQPFLDEDTLLLDSVWRSESAVIQVALDGGGVQRVTSR